MRVLVIGLGSIAKKHIAVLQSMKTDLEIVALRSNRSGSDVAGVMNIYDLNELSGQPDFIIISDPTYKHIDSIKKVMHFKKPLFIEKPLFHRLEGLDALVAELNAENISTYIACNLRFLDCLAYLKDHISSGKDRINEVNVYCGSYLPSWRPGSNYRESYSASAEMGGGVHLDLVHELDYVYWLFGKPLSVKKTLRNVSGIDIDAVDYANYNLEYKNYCADIVLNYFRRDAKRTLEIVFSEDTWLVDILKNTITSSVSGKIIFESGKKITDTYTAQMKYFLESIRAEKQMMNSIEESLEVLQVCLN